MTYIQSKSLHLLVEPPINYAFIVKVETCIEIERRCPERETVNPILVHSFRQIFSLYICHVAVLAPYVTSRNLQFLW